MKSLFILTSALLCCSVYADSNTTPSCSFDAADFDRGDKNLANCPSGYNLPAQVHLRDRSYQGFVTASYLYWNAQQDGMDLATSGSFSSGTVHKTGVEGDTFFQDFNYNSGYKVGLGYNFEQCDNWTLRADFTSLHQRNTTSLSAPDSTTGVGALYLTNWFYQTNSNQNPACEELESTWHLDLDWLDVTMSRAFYQGKKFTLSPFGGIRTSWISQSLKIEIEDVLNFSPPTDEVSSHNKLSSWAIGPRMGMEGHFLLGYGLRLQGNIGASLLFTKFDQISHSEETLTTGNSGISYNMNGYSCLRPMLETNLGLGWGMYFSKNRYHIDLSATYDFNYLWGQNRLRTLNEANTIGTASGDFDLSLQGLTVAAIFHF